MHSWKGLEITASKIDAADENGENNLMAAYSAESEYMLTMTAETVSAYKIGKKGTAFARGLHFYKNYAYLINQEAITFCDVSTL
jgi:hypothetical protein